MQTWMRQHRGPFKGGIKAGFSGPGFLLQGIDFFPEIAVSETKSEKITCQICFTNYSCWESFLKIYEFLN